MLHYLPHNVVVHGSMSHAHPTIHHSVPVRTVGDTSYRVHQLKLRFYGVDTLYAVDPVVADQHVQRALADAAAVYDQHPVTDIKQHLSIGSGLVWVLLWVFFVFDVHFTFVLCKYTCFYKVPPAFKHTHTHDFPLLFLFIQAPLHYKHHGTLHTSLNTCACCCLMMHNRSTHLLRVRLCGWGGMVCGIWCVGYGVWDMCVGIACVYLMCHGEGGYCMHGACAYVWVIHLPSTLSYTHTKKNKSHTLYTNTLLPPRYVCVAQHSG